MIVRVLGSAAGGGVPQWNCACTNCAAARAGTQPVRSQSGFALSSDGERWYLVNVSPDIAWQIEAFPPLQPRGLRGTPILGALFTDANVDHLGGLATLRQQGEHRFVLRSSATVRSLATAQIAFAAFGEAPHAWIAVAPGETCGAAFDGDPIGGDLDVRAVAVPGTTPGYAGRRAVPDAVLAWAVTDRRTGGRVLFAPVFGAIDANLRHAILAADVAFLDGSFFSDDELPSLELVDKRRLVEKTGRLPMWPRSGTAGSSFISTIRTRCWTSRRWQPATCRRLGPKSGTMEWNSRCDLEATERGESARMARARTRTRCAGRVPPAGVGGGGAASDVVRR